MDIKFYGAAQMVTGSNFLITTDEYKILIDCGMFQGNKSMERLNFDEFPYDPKEIDFLLLTHAHIDHSGRIPKLVKDGFRGKIISTNPTYELSQIMLKDSAKIQESDVKWENKKRERAGQKPIEPLYSMEDAERSLKYFEPYFLDQKIKLNENIQIRFKDAGHILGSAIIEIWIEENDETTKFVFSGDLGMPGRPIIKNPEYIEEADYLIIESTYGDTIHDSFEGSSNKLIEIINETATRGGTVIIPSFAVGRTQELIYKLNKYYENPDMEEHMKIPIYIDSPMATRATKVFEGNASSFNDEARDLILKGDNPFEFQNLRYIQSPDESKALNKFEFPKVIISASGMATAGRVRHHLKHNLWDEKNSLVFVGYQAQGTLGRILLDGVKKVKILGEEIDVQAKIYDIEGFSGHADKNVLLDWVGHFKERPKKIFIVHGEIGPATNLSNEIKKQFNINTTIPKLGDSFKIQKNKVVEVKTTEVLPSILKEDLENEFSEVNLQFDSLTKKAELFLEDDFLLRDYDIIKNKLIELQHKLMDLNIMVGK